MYPSYCSNSVKICSISCKEAAEIDMGSHSGWLLARRGGQGFTVNPRGIPKDKQKYSTGRQLSDLSSKPFAVFF